MALLDFLKALLDTIKVFLVDFGNPVRALLQALILLIEAFLQSLRATGLFGLYHVPSVTVDDFLDFFNGNQPFVEVFKASLFDAKDFNRPQPREGQTKSGFVLLVVDASDVAVLLRRIQQLLKLFGKELGTPRLKAPQNVRAFPLGKGNDPILDLPSAFGSEAKAIAVEWTLPTQVLPPDPGMEGQLATIRDEFTPPGFLVEKTSQTTGATVNHIVSQTDLRGKASNFKFLVREETGRVFREYEAYYGVAPGDFTTTFLLGQLGTFRFIDNDVVKGTRYTYRVRPFIGELGLDPVTHTMPFPEVREKRLGLRQFVQDYPGKNLVIGDPSPEVSATLYDLPTDFDVLSSLRNLFKAAFSFNFHLPLPRYATFDSNGLPTGITSTSEIGLGSIQALASSQSALSNTPAVGQVVSLGEGPTPPGAVQTYESIGNRANPPLFPWQTFAVKRRANQLAIQVAGAMLDNPGTASRYKALMTGPAPKGPLAHGLLAGTGTIEEMVSGLIRNPDAQVPVDTLSNAYNLYYVDSVYRLNLLAAIRFIRTLTEGAAEPNWQRISVTRDIVPWVGELFNDILAKIQALVDAYNGAIQEIKAFIDLIERKIEVLENFLKFLIALLDEIEALDLTVSTFNSGVVNTGVTGWVDILDTAAIQPEAPSKEPNGYSAGVAFAYVGADVEAFASALKLLFGI